jgi:soluble lytic murein transglycosylase
MLKKENHMKISKGIDIVCLFLFVVMFFFITDSIHHNKKEIHKDSKIKTFIQDIILKINSDIDSNESYILAEEIVRVSNKYDNVTPTLLTSIIYQESKFKNNSISHRGATGLGQIMPKTASWIYKKQNMTYHDSVVHNPITNIRMVAWYLNWLHTDSEMCKNNNKLVLAYYNGGIKQAYRYSLYVKNVNKEKLNKEEMVYLNLLSKETKNYVIEVLDREKEYSEKLNRG